MMLTKHLRGWLWWDRALGVGNKVGYAQALSSTPPTRINKKSGQTDVEEKHCQRCRSEIEDDHHILSACVMNNKLIQERHYSLVNKIGKELKNNLPEGKVQIERT